MLTILKVRYEDAKDGIHHACLNQEGNVVRSRDYTVRDAVLVSTKWVTDTMFKRYCYFLIRIGKNDVLCYNSASKKEVSLSPFNGDDLSMLNMAQLTGDFYYDSFQSRLWLNWGAIMRPFLCEQLTYFFEHPQFGQINSADIWKEWAKVLERLRTTADSYVDQKVIEHFFETLLKAYQVGIATTIRTDIGQCFVADSALSEKIWKQECFWNRIKEETEALAISFKQEATEQLKQRNRQDVKEGMLLKRMNFKDPTFSHSQLLVWYSDRGIERLVLEYVLASNKRFGILYKVL